ncbi:MAG TPA: hypothetical protein DCZ34_00155 [Clostridiales bacterium]|nr:hypothetical protein [Clostridiales bacterium]
MKKFLKYLSYCLFVIDVLFLLFVAIYLPIVLSKNATMKSVFTILTIVAVCLNLCYLLFVGILRINDKFKKH